MVTRRETLQRSWVSLIQTISRWERGTREITSFLHLALRAIPKKGGEYKVVTKTKMKKKGGKHGA